jgi:hypothetical protein
MAISVLDRTEYNFKLNQTDIVVGGKGEKFVPNVNMGKWADECWLNVNYPDVVTDEKEEVKDGKIEIEIGNAKHQYYIQGDKFEYDLVFKIKPAGGIVVFNLDFPAGLQWLYQDTLENDYKANKENIDKMRKISSVEEYLETANRPPNVVGSYAVYWNKKNNQYKTGKFCHVYRPKITDANQREFWCDIRVDPIAKTLTVTIPDGVVYPATLDPTFGYESVGGSNTIGYTGYLIAVSKDTASVTGTVTTAYIYSTNSSSGMDMKYSVWESSAGNPAGLVATETEFLNMGTWSATWKSMTGLTIPIASATVYWQGWCVGQNIDDYWYDTSASATRADTLSYGTAWPDPFEEEFPDNVAISIYSFMPTAGTAYAETFTDSVGVTDSLSVEANYVNAFADSIGVTDAIAVVGAYVNALADNVGVTDSVTAVANYVHALADNVGVTDALTAKADYVATLADNVGVTDVLDAAIGRVRALADSVGVTDALAVAGTYVAAFADPVGVTDAISVAANYVSAFTDSVGVTDSFSRAAQYVTEFADNVGVTDVVWGTVGFVPGAFSDPVGVTDVMSGTVTPAVPSVGGKKMMGKVSKTKG